MKAKTVYKQITIEPTNENEQEILVALLSNINFDSFEQEENKLKAFIKAEDFEEMKLVILLKGLNENFTFKIEDLPNINWNKEWEKNFQPITIAEEIYVKAPFHKPNHKVKHTIVIDPKMSFGTGHHSTTSLMLKEMLEIDFNEKLVFDYGCGTAILAIFASKLKAKNVLAIDYEEWAFKNALENIENNKAKNIQVVQGKIEVVEDQKFDVILANINRNVLLDSLQKLTTFLNPKSTILLSGIMKDDENIMLQACKKYNWKHIKTLQNKNWLMLKFKN